MNDDLNKGKTNPQDASYYAPPEDSYGAGTQESAPRVSAPAAKNFVFIGVFGLIIIGIVYAFFSGGESKKVTPRGQNNNPVGGQRAMPAIIPPPQPIPTPEPPPALPAETVTEEPKPGLFKGEDADRLKRIQSEMIITKGGGFLGGGGTGGPDAPPGNTLTEINDNDPNVGFADGFYNQKDAPFAQARKLGDTGRLITQGKIIESILETPVNTDVPGMIRAIVSRDIYAESGRTILIPKGSRLVGTYNNFVIRGNKRVNIIWTRVIRPDGIDVMIRSSGADQLGRAGIEGDVDNKYAEIFASAFLVSAINIAVGAGVDALSDKDTTQTSNTDGSTTSNSNAAHDAAVRAIDLFGNAGQNLVDGFINLKPTINIDQGTRVNVFVNRDLIFPAGLTNSVKFIQ